MPSTEVRLLLVPCNILELPIYQFHSKLLQQWCYMLLPIFRRGSTDSGVSFEMRELGKNHTGEFKFREGAAHFSFSQEFHFS